MESFETDLAANLYRLDCPDTRILGEFHMGMAPAALVGPIAAHLETCPHCTRELSELQVFLAELQPEPVATLATRVKIWIARRLADAGDSPSAVGRPAFAVRGGDAGPLMFAAGEAQLTLEVQDDVETPGTRSILGLVFGVDTADLTALLFRDETIVAETAVDDLGNFLFRGLPSGSYELLLAGPDMEIHVQALAI